MTQPTHSDHGSIPSYYTVHTMHVPGADPERDKIVQRQHAEFPDLCVHEDPIRRGILATWTEALKCAKATSSAEWSLIIQDDAIPLPGWEMVLPIALAHSPSPVLSLCHFGDYGKRLAKHGTPYGTATHSVWGQAVAYHRSVLAELIELAEDVAALNSTTYNKWDDRLPGVLNLMKGHGTTAVTTRALFDHPHLKSTVGNAGNRYRHPGLTILDPGPDWSAKPAAHHSDRKPHPIMFQLASTLTGKTQEELGR